MNTEKKVILITGCSSGIGRALAKAWHAKGEIVYAGARDTASLSQLSSAGMHALKIEVTSENDLRQALQTIEKEQGRLDVLVNNAGYGAIGPIAEVPLTELRRQFDTNVFAPIQLVQMALPLLRRAPTGTILQIGSVSADFVSPFAGVYCASKAALHALSEALRMELSPFAIRVIIVAPGAIRSYFGATAEKGLEKTLSPHSLYQSILPAIQARARASQSNPSPVEVVVQRIMREVDKDKPKPILRVGKGAFALLYLKRWLPTRTLDKILMKRFQLNKL